jgi:hypothetical protein
MRKAIWFGMSAALLAAGPAAAMVPINMQQRNTLRTIIDLPALADFFPITRIELIAPGLWRVTAGRCHIDVRMVAVQTRHSGLTGPRYEPRAERRVCEH